MWFTTCLTFGEEVARQSTGLNVPGNRLPSLGNVYGYQSASLSSGNSQGRPAAVELRNPLRPLFTKSGKSTCINSGAEIGVSASRHDSDWRKEMFFSAVVGGKVSPIYQVFLNLKRIVQILSMFRGGRLRLEQYLRTDLVYVLKPLCTARNLFCSIIDIS